MVTHLEWAGPGVPAQVSDSRTQVFTTAHTASLSNVYVHQIDYLL